MAMAQKYLFIAILCVKMSRVNWALVKTKQTTKQKFITDENNAFQIKSENKNCSRE
jgi:hypothetical protein